MDVEELVKRYSQKRVSLAQLKVELAKVSWDLTIIDDDGNWVTGPNTIHNLVNAMMAQQVGIDDQFEIIGHLNSNKPVLA